MDEQEKLFEATYSPSLVRFYLAHAEELLALASGSGGGLGEQMAHEWAQLVGGLTAEERACRECRPCCICHHLHARGYPAVLPSRGGAGDAGGRARRVVADLELAAEGLCPLWESTRRVFLVLDRAAVYDARRRGLADPAAWLRVMGVDPGYHQTTRLMALALGWKPKEAAQPEAA